MPPTETGVRRAPYHPFLARVVDVVRLSPHFVRVAFAGPEFAHLGSAGPDQRVKVLLPHAEGRFTELGQTDGAGDWYDRWRALPVAERSVFRTYTIRGLDRSAERLVIDFVVHDGAGPAGAWAEGATVGQELLVVAPDERAGAPAGGFDWHPGPARRVLIAGDETAVPAVLAIVETLAPGYEADVFVEVPEAADILPAEIAPGVRMSWLARGDRAHGAALIEAVTAWTAASGDVLARAAAPRPQELAEIDVDRELLWDSPEEAEGEFYAWIAGEAATVKLLRRMLVTEHGVDRKRVAFMGYWRLGQSERTE